MRRVLVIAAAIVGAVVIFAGAILFYAATNLNSIIAERRQNVLDKVSKALGRQVHADDIKVSLGWGILADVTGVQVADDPDISSKPFIEASNVYTRLQLMPLLARRIEVTEVVLDKPVIRIVQTRDGTFNVSTLGRKKVHSEEQSRQGEGEGGGGANEESPMAEAGKAPAALGSLLVQNFTIDDGTLIYETAGAPASATVNAINLKLRDFVFNAPFTVAVTFAALSDQQNFDLSATIGPLVSNGVLDIDAIPVTGTAKVGPILLTQLETIPMIAKAIPPKLSISGPVSFDATADGTVQSIKFTASSDLSASAVAFGDTFNKPADTPLKISAEGSRTDSSCGDDARQRDARRPRGEGDGYKSRRRHDRGACRYQQFRYRFDCEDDSGARQVQPHRQDRDSFRRDDRQWQGVGRRHGRAGRGRIVDTRCRKRRR